MTNKKLKIGLSAQDLSQRGGGTKTFIKNILRELEQLSKKSLIYFIHNSKKEKGNYPNLIETYTKIKNRLLFKFILTPFWTHENDLDVFFSPKNVLPFGVKGKKVVAVHDLAYFMPEYNAYPWLDTLYMKTMIKSSCKRANKIIAISKNTKKDIVNLLNINPKKIEVVHHAVNRKFKKVNSKQKLKKVKKKHHLPDKFILFTGGITPRKNLVRLIKAFNKISDKLPHYLILTGVKGWKNKKELRKIKKSRKIKKIGFVKEKDMPSLYNLADMYIYPSLYEGFGLPVLEAQACEVPVIASRSSSIPEVGGNGIHYINPTKISDMEKAILKVAKGKNYKQNLIKKGKKNVKRFSWKKTAEEILEILKENYDPKEQG